MTTVIQRILLASGLVLLVGGIAGLALPGLSGWPLILLALPALLIAAVLRLVATAGSTTPGK